MRHPNYAVLVLEIAVVPLALGTPLVALTFSIANATLIARRIREENRALAWVASTDTGTGELRKATLANGCLRR